MDAKAPDLAVLDRRGQVRRGGTPRVEGYPPSSNLPRDPVRLDCLCDAGGPVGRAAILKGVGQEFFEHEGHVVDGAGIHAGGVKERGHVIPQSWDRPSIGRDIGGKSCHGSMLRRSDGGIAAASRAK